MTFDHLIFDFDGTLVDSLDVAIDEMQKAASFFRYRRFDDSEIPRLKSLSAREILKDLKISNWKLPFLIPHLRKQMLRRHLEIRRHEKVLEVLREISATSKTRLDLVTSSSLKLVEKVLKEDLEMFSLVSAGWKPFNKSRALKKFDKAIYVGDEVRDIHACQKAGLPIACVAWGYNRPERLAQENPDYLFHSEREILQLVR